MPPTKRKREPDDGDGHESKSAVSAPGIKIEPGAADEVSDISESEDGSDDDFNADVDYVYREAQEPLPRFAFYDPRLASVKKSLEKTAKEANSIFKKHPCSTQDVQTLRRKVESVRHVPKGQTKVIGLVGNAGQGKSSLVSSLVDIPDLAKAEDSGESVTWVATVYRRAFDGQKQRFAVRLEYFGLEQIGKVLSDAIEDWNIYHFELPKDITEDEKKLLRYRSETTLSIFRTLFCDLTDFEDDDAGRESLNRICRSNASTEQKINVFMQQAQIMLENLGSADNMLQESLEFADKDEMHEWLDDRLLEDSTRVEPVLWPFVKEVVIAVKGSRFLERWTIADLPGLTDCNQLRVDTTLRSISKCDSLWILDSIGRINTSGIVEGLSQRYGLAFKGNVVAIGTRSAEGLKESLVATYRRKGIEIHGLQEWKSTHDAITKQLKELESSSEDKANFAEKIGQLKEERQTIDDKWWTKVAQARETFVRRELQQICQPHLPRGVTLPVFCVSNTHYLARKEGERKEKFTLPTSATGIPALREHFLSLAAPNAFREFENFIDHHYTIFIRGLELWQSKGLKKGRKRLIKVIHKPQNAIPGSFEMISDEIKESCTENVVAALHSNQLCFIGEAQDVLDKNISAQKWATLRAFIQRNGCHKTAAMSDSWNELFVAAVRRVLNDDLWYPFVSSSLEQIDELYRQVVETMSSIIEQLEREPAAYGLSLDAFSAALKGHIAGLGQAFDTSKDGLSKGLRSIILNATVDGPDNYFARAMKPAYEKCQQDSGKGVVLRWLQCLRSHIGKTGNKSPFSVMAENMETDVHNTIDRCFKELRQHVDKTFVAILTDCEAMINRKSDTASEKDLRQDVTKFIRKALQEFESIKAERKAIKEQYPAEMAVQSV